MIDSKGLVHISAGTVKSVEVEQDLDVDIFGNGADQERISSEYWTICERAELIPHTRQLNEHGDFEMGSVLEAKKDRFVLQVGPEMVKGIDSPKKRAEALYHLSSTLSTMFEVAAVAIGSCVKTEKIVSQASDDILIMTRKLKKSEAERVDPQSNAMIAQTEFNDYRHRNRELYGYIKRLAISNHQTLDFYRESVFSGQVNPNSIELMDRDANYHHLNVAYMQAFYIMLKTCSVTTVAFERSE